MYTYTEHKISSRLSNRTFPLSEDPNITDLLQREQWNTPDFIWNRSMVG